MTLKTSSAARPEQQAAARRAGSARRRPARRAAAPPTNAYGRPVAATTAPGDRVAERPGQHDADDREHQREAERRRRRAAATAARTAAAPTSPRPSSALRDRQPAAPGRGVAPGPSRPAGAAGDDLDDVVVGQLRPVVPARDEVQQFAVANALRGQVAGGFEHGAGGPAQHPAAVLAPRRRRRSSPACRSRCGSNSATSSVVGQGDVDAPLRCGDGHPGQAEATRGRHAGHLPVDVCAVGTPAAARAEPSTDRRRPAPPAAVPRRRRCL